MKYRKIPVEIEAIQFTRSNLETIHKKFDKNKILVMIEKCPNAKMIGQIETLEGTMFVNENDYIIQGIEGEIYSCKKEIFEKTYEKVI